MPTLSSLLNQPGANTANPWGTFASPRGTFDPNEGYSSLSGLDRGEYAAMRNAQRGDPFPGYVVFGDQPNSMDLTEMPQDLRQFAVQNDGQWMLPAAANAEWQRRMLSGEARNFSRPREGFLQHLLGDSSLTRTLDKGDLGYQAVEKGYGPYLAMLAAGAAAGAGVGGAAAGEVGAAGGGAGAYEGAVAAGELSAAGGAAGGAAAGGAGAGTAAGEYSLASSAAGPGLSSQVGGTVAGTTGAGTTAAGTAAAGTALSRILDGTATTADYVSVAGQAGATGLGLLGDRASEKAYRDMVNQYLGLGAPSRARLEASYAPGFDLASGDPAFASALDRAGQSAARGASAKYGNPAGNPGAMAEIQKYITESVSLPYLLNYRGQNAAAGGLGVPGATQASLARAGGAGDIYDVLGYGLGEVTRPRNSLADILKMMQASGRNNLTTAY